MSAETVDVVDTQPARPVSAMPLGLWRPDQGVEDWLASENVTWVYKEAVPLSEIDIPRSLKNQARLITDPVDPDRVVEMIERAREGLRFPAVCVFRPAKNRKLLMIDGNHRTAMAAGLGDAPLAVYDVTGISDVTARLLTITANRQHGEQVPYDHRLIQALDLVNTGFKIALAARKAGVKQGDLSALSARQTADRRATEAGVLMPVWESLSPPIRSRLGQIHTDEGLVDAVKLVRDSGATADMVFELVTAVNQTKRGGTQREIVEGYRQTWSSRISESAGGALAAGRGREKGRTPKMHAGSLVTSVLRLDPKILVPQYTEVERDAAAARYREASEVLRGIADKIAKG